jgi:transcriptional regulator of arginine metabolism
VDVMKSLRHAAIRDVVSSRPVRTQHELVAALRDRGLRATQATVSRDIREMALLKTGPVGGQVYVLPAPPDDTRAGGEQRLRQLLGDMPVELRVAGLLLVVRAVPGSAHAIAAALDRARWPEVVGSVAGDDTLFVAFADAEALERVRLRLRDIIGRPGTDPTG